MQRLHRVLNHGKFHRIQSGLASLAERGEHAQCGLNRLRQSTERFSNGLRGSGNSLNQWSGRAKRSSQRATERPRQLAHSRKQLAEHGTYVTNSIEHLLETIGNTRREIGNAAAAVLQQTAHILGKR